MLLCVYFLLLLLLLLLQLGNHLSGYKMLGYPLCFLSTLKILNIIKFFSILGCCCIKIPPVKGLFLVDKHSFLFSSLKFFFLFFNVLNFAVPVYMWNLFLSPFFLHSECIYGMKIHEFLQLLTVSVTYLQILFVCSSLPFFYLEIRLDLLRASPIIL